MVHESFRMRARLRMLLYQPNWLLYPDLDYPETARYGLHPAPGVDEYGVWREFFASDGEADRRQERLKVCSGRDELCHSVLNNDWASHPTWASEDSGFVAHRKNTFEETLHRIEEERHDYDFNIEANQRTIQLLEPIAQTIARMSPEERENFVLPPGIGAPSTAIYNRLFKKLYGKKEGINVINAMFAKPCAVVPIVLARLKQKDEEWRAVQVSASGCFETLCIPA